MMEASAGNTRDRWERRFTHGEWSEVSGSELTETFARCIVDALPLWVTQEIGRPGTQILDWGCALGEGVGVFRETWTSAQVAGMDFSRVAIDTALDTYGPPFHWEADGKLQDEVDVLITSNVLEHLIEPHWVMATQMPFVRSFYILLVPFEEDLGSPEAEAMTPRQRSDAGHTHVQKFTIDSFPDEFTDDRGRIWKMRVRRTDIVPGPVWPGRQLLIVYEAP